jgi:hypothetical protein
MENKELKENADIEIIAMDKLKNKWGHLYTFGYPKRPFPTNYENDLNNIKIGLYEGKKWQAEKMYSEEDMRKAFSYYSQRLILGYKYIDVYFKEWLIKEFKNK